VTYPFFGTISGLYDQSVDTLSGYAEGSLAFSETGTLNAAVRMDDISGLDEVWTKRLAYIQEVPDLQSRFRLSWGDGFKKPSFFALGNPTIGNPDLLPEESDLYEISLETSLSEGRIQIVNTIFRQEYSNLIDFVEGPPPMLANLDSVINKGFTSQLRAQLPTNGWLSLSASYLSVEVVDSDELLRNRPKWRLGASLVQPVGEDLELVVSGRYVDSRLDSSIPTGTVELDAYFRVDAGIQWVVSETITATIAVDNILDENYEDAIGFTNPGVRVRGGVRLNW
jgi:outer membrane cobalamin receptor